MKKTFIAVSFFFVLQTCAAQQKELDSLLGVLKNHPAEDETKCKILNEIAYDYCEIDPEKGLKAADQALLLSQKLQDKINEVTAYGYKGLNYLRMGMDTLAEEMYKKSIEVCNQIKNKKGSASSLYQLGEIYFNRGDYVKALDNLDQAQKLMGPDSDEFVLNIYNSTGGIYSSIANYTKALEYYFKALKLADKVKNEQSSATVLGNIGVLYFELNEFSKALDYHKQAINLYEHLGNRNGIATELEGIGIVYDNLKDKAKALQFYKKALQINESINNKRGVANNLSNTGIVYYDIGNYAEAMKYFLKAVALYEGLEDKYSLSTVLNMIGDTYTNASDTVLASFGNTKKRYTTANGYNNRALRLAKDAGALSQQEEILQSISTVYEKQKDYVKALEIYKELLPLHDSILNNKKKDEITRQELNYDFEKKQNLAAVEIQRQQTIRNTAIGAGIILLIAAFTTFVFYKRRRDAEEQKTAAEFKVRVGDVEMKALRSQMNPHFIFNSLHSVNKYMMDNDKESASGYLSKFSKLMRLILENSREQEVTLEKDLQALELYMQLESLRFGNRFQYKIELDPDIDVENTLIPPMLLQPFVENAIVHGIANKKDGLVRIKVDREDNLIKCIVEDNGIGRKQSIVIEREKDKNHVSLGLKITQERLNILNHIKKVKAAIDIFDLKDSNDNPTGLRIELSLPFEQAF